MGTYDISLKKDKKIIFPRICVVCENSNPDDEVSLSILGTNSKSLTWEVVDLACYGRTYGTNTNTNIKKIPACKHCSNSLKNYHRLFKFCQYTGWIPGIALLVLFKLNAIVTTILVLMGIVIPPVLTIIFPPAFGATILNDKVTFEFKSQKVAEEFKKLNIEI